MGNAIFQVEGIVVVDEVMFGRLMGQVDGIEKDVGEIKDALADNGQPGLVSTTIRNSKDIERMDKDLDRVVAASKDAANAACQNGKDIADLRTLLSQYIADPIHTPEGYLAKYWKKVVAGLLAVSVFVHVVLPRDMSLWELAKHLLGL